MRDKIKLLRIRLYYCFCYAVDLRDMTVEMVKYRADTTSAVGLKVYLERRQARG
jgi:hypothetical protein